MPLASTKQSQEIDMATEQVDRSSIQWIGFLFRKLIDSGEEAQFLIRSDSPVEQQLDQISSLVTEIRLSLDMRQRGLADGTIEPLPGSR